MRREHAMHAQGRPTTVLIGVLGLICLILGYRWAQRPIAAAGLAGWVLLCVRLPGLGWRSGRRCQETDLLAPSDQSRNSPTKRLPPRTDSDSLVIEMLAQGRFALLLRSQIASGLSETQWAATQRQLEETMAFVPEGEVAIGLAAEASDHEDLDPRELATRQGQVVRVGQFFLDRYPVTNRQFWEFVAAGGYQQVALWDQTIWPAVLDFVDRTGQPGPRFWRNSSWEVGKENHPVVGVSFYEAAAYARWVGKRLASDAEWIKAGSWPVPLSPGVRQQRRYPWGESMDRCLANVWGSGPDGTVAVDQFAAGASVGGVYHLIGNVWEWTSGDYQALSNAEDLVLPTPMRIIRGGAYDTYFDHQADCQFASGENPLSRKHNIGFRCAISVRDLTLGRSIASEVPNCAAQIREAVA